MCMNNSMMKVQAPCVSYPHPDDGKLAKTNAQKELGVLYLYRQLI
jgi:hypothetical protein